MEANRMSSLGNVLACCLFFLMLFHPTLSSAALQLTPGGLLHFADQTEFETGFPALTSEDFEESTVAAASVLFGDQLDSTTDGLGGFSAGDIVDGLIIRAVGTSHSGCPGDCSMAVYGSGYCGWAPASVSVGAVSSGDPTGILFTESGIRAVGFDLTGTAAVTASVNVFGATGLIDTINVSITAASQTFVGIYSNQPVSIIEITAGASVLMVDNIQFGAVTSELTYSNTLTAFESSHPGLALEDLEESPVAAGTGVPVAEPLDSTTNAPGAFVPGDIVEGLQIKTVSTANPATSLAVLGDHFALQPVDNSSIVVGTNYLADNLQLLFTNNNAYAVALDLLRVIAAGDVTIVIYGPHGIVLGTTTRPIQLTETFFGVYSKQPITRIDVLSSDAEFCDNIRFGGAPAGLTFYTSQSALENDFESSLTRLEVEDFTESTVAPSTILICDEPFDESTDNSCFSAGDIASGITISTVEGFTCPNCMFVYGENFVCGNSPKTIGAFAGGDRLKIDFMPHVTTAGFFVYNNTFYVDIYGENNRLLGTGYLPSYQCAGGFWGVKSTEPIARMVLGKKWAINYLDSVIFGSRFPWGTFMPAFFGKSAP